MERTACNFCGSTACETVFTLPDYMLARREVLTTLVRCGECGLIYQNPRPTPDEMASHYPPGYDLYDPDPDARSTPLLLRTAYRFGMRKRARLVTSQKRGGRLLDVGCSTGTFLLEMQTHAGWDVEGLEISPYAADIARRHGLNVTTGSLEQAGYRGGSFDAITLWDVLEHLHDPKSSLKEMHRILKPDGIIVLRVPNLDSWDAKIFGEYWVGLDAPRHLFVFGRKNIRDMLKSAGFRVLAMQTKLGNYPTTVLSLRFWLTARGMYPAHAWLIDILNSPPARLLSAPLFWLASQGLRGGQMTVTAVKGN